jgi:hypothetical protein
MKHLILFLLVIGTLFYPQKSGKSQSDSSLIKTDTTYKVYQRALRSFDSANVLSNSVENKLSNFDKPKIVYRTKTVIKHVPVKVVVHDTVFYTETKYVAVPTDAYKFKQFQRYNDSLKASQHPKPIKKKHKFLGL